MLKEKRIVVIGGGHGQAQICRGIKNIPNTHISAIVTVADDGGSTGRLRRQFNIPAMGDIRNVMIALASQETLFSSLMDYRFDDPSGKEKDVAGHNLGNLILTALTDQSGSFFEAVKMLDDVLNVKGEIIPATTQVITLFARMHDGVIVKGEENIPHLDNKITRVFYEEEVHATPDAIRAITEADLIIYGIGSVYTSILPNVIIPEISNALQDTRARRVYFCNAMTQPGETDGYSVEDHVRALIQHGAMVDEVLVASDALPLENVERYKAQGSTPVFLSQDEHEYTVLRKDLLTFENGQIKHDAKKIHTAVTELLEDL
ncbi:MAG: gluconeogenesis factor YvcK family protein [Bulleidia sp.]|nr:gluconeogenesis factor YvcK family protein [Bulleidia sp.]